MLRDVIDPKSVQLSDALDQLSIARALLNLIGMAHRKPGGDDDRAVSAGCDEVASRLRCAIELIEMVREGGVA